MINLLLQIHISCDIVFLL